MAILKVIELLSESNKSWEDAAQNGINGAAKTLKNIRSIYVKELTAHVEKNKITSYRVNVQLTFELEGR